MKKVFWGIIVAVFLVLMAGMACADHGHIVLLAVYHDGTNFSGSPADLQLEIVPGSGRVFMETIPVSKVDTQISTRFAKQVACKFTEIDCSKYDFFYTIKSTAAIVGGPSAGGAITALTASMLIGLPIDTSVSITGTINSGDFIGPVGSLKEKVDAAKMAGIKKVLIPAVQQELTEDNVTTVVEYGESIGVEVIPVNTLSEVMTELTGKEFVEEEQEIEVTEEYTNVMKAVSDRLCKRAKMLIQESPSFDLTQEQEDVVRSLKDIQEAKNLTITANQAIQDGNFYSAASYCFRSCLAAQRVIFRQKDDLTEEKTYLQERAEELDEEIEAREKKTITDLQTYMIVKERVVEAKQLAESNESDVLAFAKERLNSADAWATFFGQEGERYELDQEDLKKSCQTTLNEVEERFQYLNMYFPGIIADLRKNLDGAHGYYDQGEYALCIFVASKTKAEANIIVTLLGVKEDQVSQIRKLKLAAAKKSINQEIKKGTFPILAYSYYEYSSLLDDEVSSLLYAEYALELSDISIYLEKKKNEFDFSRLIVLLPVLLFLWGLLLGYLWGILKHRPDPKKKDKKTKENLKGKKKKNKKPVQRGRIRLRG